MKEELIEQLNEINQNYYGNGYLETEDFEWMMDNIIKQYPEILDKDIVTGISKCYPNDYDDFSYNIFFAHTIHDVVDMLELACKL